MEINYLREFIVLTQTSNFLEAADILYSSQSTLSKHLKKLELELGVSLFSRTTRKVEISNFGKILLPYAKQIVDLQDKGNEILRSNLNLDHEILTLGSIPALAQYSITDIFVKFKKSRPQATINVIQAGSTGMKEMLRQKKCELAFIRDYNEIDDDLVKIPYAIDFLVVVLPINHALAKMKKIPLHLLKDEDFLMIEKQTMLYRLNIKTCKQNGFEPRITYTDDKMENIIDLVGKGMGISLLMKRLAYYVYNPNVAIIEVTPTVSTYISLCYLKDVQLSKAAQHFITCFDPLKPNSGLLSKQEIQT